MRKCLRRFATALMFVSLGYTLISLQSKQSAFMFGLPYPSDDTHLAIAGFCSVSCILVLLLQPKEDFGVIGVVASTVIAFGALFLLLFIYMVWSFDLSGI